MTDNSGLAYQTATGQEDAAKLQPNRMALVLVIATCFATPVLVGQDDPRHLRSLQIDPTLDLAAASALTVVGAALFYVDQNAGPDPRRQSAFINTPLEFGTPYQDGVFGSVAFRPNRTWRNYTDLALFTAPLLALTLPTANGGGKRFLGKKLIVYQSIMLTWMLTGVGKYATGRPRPYTLYQPDPSWMGPDEVHGADLIADCNQDGCRFTEAEAFWSFPSGHTSIVAAAAVSFVSTELLANRKRRAWHWALLAPPLIIGGLSGYGRVRAGRHRPSDVSAGFALGATLGLLVPLAHTRRLSVSPGPGDFGLSVGAVLR